VGNLFKRIVKLAGSIRTTKTMNKKTGRVKTKITRVKPGVKKRK